MNPEPLQQEDLWAERGNYWLGKLHPIRNYKARKRRIIHRPLVLSGHGIRLHIDYGTLVIKCGFTHYPQKREEYRFFPRDRQLPSRIVILDGDGSITFDALEWLSEQNVPLVQVNWRGEVVSVGGAHYSAEPNLVKYQFEFGNTAEAFDFSKWLIFKKIENSCKTISYISNNSPEAQLIIQKMTAQAEKLQNTPPKTILELLTLEGIVAAAYFRYWYTISLKWKGTNRKPIPQEWHQIGTRTGVFHSRYATHPVNAILNYAYAILENQVRTQLLVLGVDPAIGFLHSVEESRNSLVFDLMEPVRPIMDKRILEFILAHTFSPADFILNKNGVCRLHPQFARFIVKYIQDIPEIETITAANLKRLFASNLKKRKKPASLQLIQPENNAIN